MRRRLNLSAVRGPTRPLGCEQAITIEFPCSRRAMRSKCKFNKPGIRGMSVFRFGGERDETRDADVAGGVRTRLREPRRRARADAGRQARGALGYPGASRQDHANLSGLRGSQRIAWRGHADRARQPDRLPESNRLPGPRQEYPDEDG